MRADPRATLLRGASQSVSASRGGGARPPHCREFPSEMNCSLTIAGDESEVLPTSVHHAITVHGHEDTPELREELRKLLKDEVPAAV